MDALVAFLWAETEVENVKTEMHSDFYMNYDIFFNQMQKYEFLNSLNYFKIFVVTKFHCECRCVMQHLQHKLKSTRTNPYASMVSVKIFSCIFSYIPMQIFTQIHGQRYTIYTGITWLKIYIYSKYITEWIIM